MHRTQFFIGITSRLVIRKPNITDCILKKIVNQFSGNNFHFRKTVYNFTIDPCIRTRLPGTSKKMDVSATFDISSIIRHFVTILGCISQYFILLDT